MSVCFIPDGGSIELINYNGSDLEVVNTARVSFNKRSSVKSEKDVKLLKYLWENGHTSPFRHCYFSFRIKCPIFVLRQWQKHQVGCAWNEASGRYIQFENDPHLVTKWRAHADNVKQGSKGLINEEQSMVAWATYLNAMKHAYFAYEELIKAGVCKEQARMVLPLAQMTHSIWTASLQAVIHFLTLRMDSHAQYEVRQYATAVNEVILGIEGNSFKDSLIHFGP